MDYVVLDIETTGLDIENASVIEVGAIIVEDKSIRQKYSSFVAYNGELPETVKRITGITEDMLRGAPPISQVIAELSAFIGKRPVVSHNGLAFDFPILEREGMRFEDKHDSMEFAFFVLPTNYNGHSVVALAEYYSMAEVVHRALADCEMEFALVQELRRSFGEKPKKKREALKGLAERIGWWWAGILLGKAGESVSLASLVQDYEPYRKEVAEQEVIAFETKSIDLQEVERQFAPRSGQSPDEDYSEDRPEQKKMAALIAHAYNCCRHAVIEAGTGTGKSKAYLVPSLLFALKNKIPIIISTHTKALQDQLFVKEIPHLKATVSPEIRVAVLKGKRNYVCLGKFEELGAEVMQELTQRSLYEYAEAGTRYTTRLAYLLLASWITETERGDWDEVPYWLREKMPKRIEADICNIDELCGPKMCDFFDAQKCFLAKARMRSRDADLVIVNHAIALGGIILESEDEKDNSLRPEEEAAPKTYGHTIFPVEAKFIVFDEAHHLENDATSAWEYVVSEGSMQLLLQQLYGRRGAKHLIRSIAQRRNTERLIALANSFEQGEGDLRFVMQTVFQEILPKLVPEDTNHGSRTYCMLNEIPEGTEIKKALLESVKNLAGRLRGIKQSMESIAEDADSEKMQRILYARGRAIKHLLEALTAFTGSGKEYVRYLERSGSNIELKASPLSVAPYLKSYVYDNFSSVILTSATLTVDRSFQFFAQRCGTCFVESPQIDYHLFKSSFDYTKQCRFLVPKGISYSGKPDKHLAKCVLFLEQAIIASGGGSLVLCSSHAQVDKLYERLVCPLARRNIWLLRQPKGGSSTTVIRDFRRDINSALIGTKTLWQGIDVPGDSLRSLFIYKIPYDRPDDPLIKARRAEIDQVGGNSFAEYYEPLAALAIKQGFGRLIRKSTDIGVAVFLDEDLLKKSRIVGSLPDGVKVYHIDPERIFAVLRSRAQTVLNSQAPLSKETVVYS